MKAKEIKVFYGFKNLVGETGKIHGGLVKFQRLQKIFSNNSDHYNILYIGSSSMPQDWKNIVKKAKKKNVKIVWNQDGVGYKGFAPGWEIKNWKKAINEPMGEILHASDYVIYQSNFSKLSADIFLGKKLGNSEVLYNAVDTQFFTPVEKKLKRDPLVIILGGTQYHFDKIETALKTLVLIIRKGINTKLLITGKLCWPDPTNSQEKTLNALMKQLNVKDHVKLIGFHSQADAPSIYKKAHLILHPKYNDPCPSTVIEAMSCGLPVVYSHSGGVPELVGEDAGIGIYAPLSWEKYIIPDYNLMAEAIINITEDYEKYSKAARQQAVENFDIKHYINRHKLIFEKVLSDNLIFNELQGLRQ